MVTDDERREVARRLRDSAEERMAVTGRGNGNSWSWLYRSIFGSYMGTEKGAKGHYVEVAHRLADLIEPTKPVDFDGFAVDRDALLELADELDKQSDGGSFVFWGELRKYARRIREACGEEAKDEA